MKKSTPVEDDVWILRNPVHDQRRRMQQGKIWIDLLFPEHFLTIPSKLPF